MSALTDLHGQMNNDFKYILQPYKGMATRYICPQCQKKKQFTLYIDQQTGQPLADNVGLCNRAVNCGYHYTPKQFFQDKKEFNTDTKPNTTQGTPRIIEPQKQKPISLISFDLLEKTLKAYDQNHFAQFLIKRLGNKIAEDVAGLYYLGTSKHWKGATVFWQIDIEGRVRTGKIMLYNPNTGKRIKEPYPHINWIHKVLKYKDYNLNQCLFGEHLLSIYPQKQIAIVESEKTAMLCAGHLPEINWLASGNLNNLSAKRLQCLKGKKVTLYPDAGAFKIWKDKAEQLKDIASFTVSDLIETRATPEQLKEGYDMADYLTLAPFKSVRRKECEQTAKPTKEDYNTLESDQRAIDQNENKDSFFEKLKATQTKEKLEFWPVNELEEYFKKVSLPEEPIQLDSSGLIINLQNFIESNISIVKLHNGKEIYRPYFARLTELKNYLEKN
jgi:hypothetical protein